MKLNVLKALSYLSFIFFLFLLLTTLWTGLQTHPSEGDSIHLHIPLAKAILDGSILHPSSAGLVPYPAASEIILAAFVLLHIPLNIFNVVALICLFLVTYFLGKKFSFSKDYSLLFSSTICSLYGILRYTTSQKIDVWMLIFFVLSLLLLQHPKKTLKYFLLLGFSVGMVIGSKYSGPFFAFVLLGIYSKELIKTINISRLIVFLLPFSLFGLSWYIRNILNTGDPFYPQNFLIFKGDPNSNWYSWQYWQVALFYPSYMINALVSEFMIWSAGFILIPLLLLYQKFKHHTVVLSKKILLLVLLTTIIFLALPPPPLKSYTSVIFGIRYGFPAIFLLILLIFILAQKMKKQPLLASISFANISFLLLPVAYHPKFLFLFVPLVMGILLIVHRVCDTIDRKK